MKGFRNELEFVIAPRWATPNGMKPENQQLWILNHTEGKASWANEKNLTEHALWSMAFPYRKLIISIDDYLDIRFAEVHPRNESTYEFDSKSERSVEERNAKRNDMNKALYRKEHQIPETYEEEITDFSF
jgi:hypothetical protein